MYHHTHSNFPPHVPVPTLIPNAHAAIAGFITAALNLVSVDYEDLFRLDTETEAKHPVYGNCAMRLAGADPRRSHHHI